MFQRHGLFVIIIFFISPLQAQHRATATISDSIDITHFTIHLDITDLAGHTIHGYTTVECIALVDNITEIPLDLSALTVDSVEAEDGSNLSYTHIDTKLLIDLSATYNTGNNFKIKVFYGGEPVSDVYFGGWVWTTNYIFQLGVSFEEVPHSYGRAWFPCFDNFVERSTYRCEIITPADKKAFCGGLLENEIDSGDGTKTWIWDINQTIPSYLASVAVGNYATVNLSYTGIEKEIPIQYGVLASDSTDMKNSFVNLPSAIGIFENRFGPYQWDRVGYVVTSVGAMEHAMNVAYPYFIIDGSTAYESIMVHELAHNWWGNAVTCSGAEEMWLNEGWAEYSSYVFFEDRYGEDTYRDIVKNNHLNVLHYSAATDGNNYFPVSGVPEDYTYGSTVYYKGADVIHTLRSYMGDENFFSCMTAYADAFKFQSASTADLRDFLTDCSGMDLTPYFDNWIYAAGFPGFEIEDVGYSDYATTFAVCIEQKLNHAPNYYTNVPLTLTLFDDAWNIIHEEDIMASGELTTILLPPDIPVSHNIIIDYHEKISDAVTADELIIKETGEYDLDNALMEITVNSLTDSAIIYAQHYWVGADNFKTAVPGLHVNTQRYWKIFGVLPVDFQAEAKFVFNGKLTTSGGYLDNEFITNSDDSLVLLYRMDQNDDWEIYPYYELNTFSLTTDKYGAMELSSLLLGEYTIGMYDHTQATKPADEIIICANDESLVENADAFMQIFPNPAQDYIYFRFETDHLFTTIDIYDVIGNVMKSVSVAHAYTYTLSVKDLPAGTYQIKCTSVDNTLVASEKLIIIR